MRSFQVLLAGSNPATRLISSFCSDPSMPSQAEQTSCEAYAFKFFDFNKQGIKAAQTFRAALFYVIKPKSSIRYKDSKGK